MKDKNLELIQAHRRSSQLGLSQMENPDVAKKRADSEKEKQAKELMKRFKNGYDLISNEIKENASDQETIDSCVMNDDAKEVTNDLESWKEQLNEEEELQTLFGYSNDVLVKFYELASQHYENKNYDEAINAFTFLCQLNPEISSFWIGLAMSFEAKQKYVKAIETFERAFKAEPSDFDPFLGMIRCSEEIKDFQKVQDLLEAELENPTLKEEMKEALQYIKTLQR